VIAATHSFSKSLIGTLIMDSVNPIEKAERSCLIVASNIYSTPVKEMIKDNQVERIKTYSPMLLSDDSKLLTSK
jgi:hypothetical protein